MPEADDGRGLRRLVGPRPRPRRLLLPAGHIFVLSAFAIAQPLFYLFSRNAAFFAVRGSPPRDIVLFTLGLLLVPPAVLMLVEVLFALVGERAWRAVHLLFIAGLSALIVLQAAKRVADGTGLSLIVLAAAVGAALAFVYVRFAAARSFLTVLIPAPLVLTALFLFHSPIERLVFVHEPDVKSAHVTAEIPVVFVVFDELSTVSLLTASEEINAKRFPNFAALGKHATFYREATTVHAFTEHAVPSILTGKLPAQDELPIYADHPDNLFTLLGDGYRVFARESLTHLCPPRICRPSTRTPQLRSRISSLVSDSSVLYLHVILPSKLREGLPPVDRTWANFRGMTVDDEGGGGADPGGFSACAPVCGFVKNFSSDHPASLYFLHVQLPHIPWRYLPSGHRYLGDTRTIPGLTDRVWDDNSFLTEAGNERYLLQLGYTDRALGLVLDRLHESDLYDDALVVVAADHGVSFRPGGPRRDPTAENLHELAFMPLFVKLPHQSKGQVVDGFAPTIDILPTIADALGIQIPWKVDGQSLLDRDLPSDGTVALHGKSKEFAEDSLSELLRLRAAALRRQTELFGDGGWDEIYRFGPHSELVGRPLTELDVGHADGMTVELDGRALLDAYDPKSPVSPAYVTGRIPGGDAGADLAVAVNGRIVATTQTYDSFGDARLAVFIPEDSLEAGENDVDVLAVGADGGLELIDPAAPPLSLAEGSLRRADGTNLRLDPDAIHGVVDAERRGERFVFSGWAADVEQGRPVDSIAIFVDARLIYLTHGTTFRTLEPQQHEGVADAAFRFGLPRNLLPVQGSAHVVRVFAVSGDTAAELEYGPGYPWEHVPDG